MPKKSIAEAVNSQLKSKFDLNSFKEKKLLNGNVKFKEQQWIPFSEALQRTLSIPGIPMGHISMVRGKSNTGKSTTAIETIVSAQKSGILPVIIITEMKHDWEHFKTMGFEMTEVKELDEWADDIISEKMVMGADTNASSGGTVYEEEGIQSNNPQGIPESELNSPKKSEVPATFRKDSGKPDWKLTQKDLDDIKALTNALSSFSITGTSTPKSLIKSTSTSSTPKTSNPIFSVGQEVLCGPYGPWHWDGFLKAKVLAIKSIDKNDLDQIKNFKELDDYITIKGKINFALGSSYLVIVSVENVFTVKCETIDDFEYLPLGEKRYE